MAYVQLQRNTLVFHPDGLARFVQRVKNIESPKDLFIIETLRTGKKLAVFRNEIKKQNKIVQSRIRNKSIYCRNGHLYTISNTYLYFDKRSNIQVRFCRKCHVQTSRRYRLKYHTSLRIAS